MKCNREPNIAFDSISHPILLQKLDRIGASDKVVDWFKSYLTDRKQFVRIGSATSSPLDITRGIPQGAILSPLLFCIYLNDLPLAIEMCRIESYVDDSKILLSFSIKDSTSAEQNLEKDLLRVAAWCCTNNLLIDADKTKFPLIGTHQMLQKLPKDMSLFFRGKLITPVTTA